MRRFLVHNYVGDAASERQNVLLRIVRLESKFGRGDTVVCGAWADFPDFDLDGVCSKMDEV